MSFATSLHSILMLTIFDYPLLMPSFSTLFNYLHSLWLDLFYVLQELHLTSPVLPYWSARSLHTAGELSCFVRFLIHKVDNRCFSPLTVLKRSDVIKSIPPCGRHHKTSLMSPDIFEHCSSCNYALEDQSFLPNFSV